MEHFTADISVVFKLNTNLESAVLEKMSTISMSHKLETSIKGSKVNQKAFPFLSVLLKLELTTNSAFLIWKKPKLISDIINLLIPETTGWMYWH